MASSREESDIEKTNTLDLLLDDVKLHLFSFFSLNEVSLMQQTSHRFHRFLNEDEFWRPLYRQRFGALFFYKDVKNQFAANYLRSKCVLNRPDVKQPQLRIAYHFLKKHQEKKWAKYNLAQHYFYGHGTKKDEEKAYDLFLEGYSYGDHRAAILLLEILSDYKERPDDYQWLKEKIGNQQLAYLVEDVFFLSENPPYPYPWRHHAVQAYAARIIARMYLYGVEVEMNFEKAEEILFSLVRDTILGVYILSSYKFISLQAGGHDSEKFHLVIQYLRSLNGMNKSHVECLVEHYLGEIDYSLNRYEEAASHYSKSTSLFYSLERLAEIKASEGDFDSAIEHYKSAIKLNYQKQVAPKIFILLCTRDGLTSAIQSMLELLPDCAMDIAISVSHQIRQVDRIEKICQNADYVWWLQYAAQAGCEDSLNALTLLDSVSYPNVYPYVNVALGIIFQNGVLGSSLIQQDIERASDYFRLLPDKRVLEEYFEAGLRLEKDSEEMKVLIDSYKQFALASLLTPKLS